MSTENPPGIVRLAAAAATGTGLAVSADAIGRRLG